MALIRYSPFHETEALQRDMNRMFEALASDNRDSMRQSFVPLAEMEQTEDAIHLKVEVPGMNADDLDVQVTKEAVMISGERKSVSKSKKNGTRRSEFRYGSFQRTIPLPIPIDNDRVTGDYQDGILTLELPKLQKQENKVTKVNISGNNSHSQINGSSQNGTADISAKEQANTNGSGEPSAENANLQNETGGYGNQDVWNDSQQADSQQTAAS